MAHVICMISMMVVSITVPMSIVMIHHHWIRISVWRFRHFMSKDHLLVSKCLGNSERNKKTFSSTVRISFVRDGNKWHHCLETSSHFYSHAYL